MFCHKPSMRQKNGASDRNRTGDNHVGNVMLYQLSYTRISVYSFIIYIHFSEKQIIFSSFLKKNKKSLKNSEIILQKAYYFFQRQ